MVESLKGGYGFIDYRVSESETNLYFHSSNVVDNTQLNPGDSVDFEMTFNSSRQKHTAVNVRLLCRKEDAPVAPRPKRLLLQRNLIRSGGSGAKKSHGCFGLLRTPTIPDGTRGFTLERTELLVVDAGLLVAEKAIGAVGTSQVGIEG